ncbi:MAG TPA: hypothetical protein VK095_07565 [Beutenbergiaceae bacterium]|nr:hypothetical protein [Beutenbergiaceae bacterium]
MDVMKRRRVRVRRLTGVALTGVLAAALLAPAGAPSAQADTDPPDLQDDPVIAEGDALVTNHSFEAELEGWSLTDGYGDDPAAACQDGLSTSAEWSTDGDASLLIGADRSCRQAGAISDVVPIEPEQTYTTWADIHDSTIAWIGLHWVDAEEQVIGTEHGHRDVRSDRLELSAEPPEGATGVQVELGAIGELYVDNVLLSAEVTALGSQVNKRPQFLSSEAGVDENGRDVIWGMATGSEDDPGILMATDVLTGEITRTVRLPGATGGWAVNQNPVTGTVYVGTYGAAALWLYTPGEEEAVNAGQPDIPHWNFAYNVAFDEEGNAYGGGWGEPTDGYPGASVYTFTEGEGFTGVLGDLPLTDNANYTRSLGYDEGSRTVFVGTGTTVNLFACSIDTNECENLAPLLDEEIQDSVSVRDMVMSDGHVLAWAGDSTSSGNDWLVVLDVDRTEDGELQVDVVDEIRGVAHPGSSPIHDGHIYYTKSGFDDWPLFRYNIETGEETNLGHDVVILARQWDILELDDPQWPGATLVGINSYGYLTRYNIETDTIDVEQVPNVPDVSLRLNSLATGPDGSIWTAGYLGGGIGQLTTMRDDEQDTFDVGGQADSMIAHDGQVFQGNYPGGTITSFTPEQLRDGQAPTLECTIGASQDRPYGLHSSGDRLYFGSQTGAGNTVGAFGWFDSATGDCTTIEGPLGQQSVDTLTGSGDRIFGGGNIFFGYTHMPVLEEATVMVFDETTEEIEEIELPVDGLRAVSAAATDDEGTVWFYAEGWLLAMDPDTLEWVHTEEVFPDLKPGDRVPGAYAEMITAQDGTIYGNVEGRVFDFDPEAALSSGSAQDHLDVIYTGAGPYLTLDDYGNLYTRHGATGLLRIVPEAA